MQIPCELKAMFTVKLTSGISETFYILRKKNSFPRENKFVYTLRAPSIGGVHKFWREKKLQNIRHIVYEFRTLFWKSF